jgi:hypothetical protein
LPSATLGKAFAECFYGFAECFRHSTKAAILVVVEPTRGEDSRWEKDKLGLLLIYKVKNISRVDWIDCGVQSAVLKALL